jgi:hypothetical protein
MSTSKIVLPKEHGSWAMFLLPVLLGTFLSGPEWRHLVFIFGWFFLYLASTPLLNIIRNKRKKKTMLPWLWRYSLISMVFLVPLLIQMPMLMLFGAGFLPFLLINVYFIKKRRERALLNDLSGILIFTLGGSASYYVGTEQFTSELFALIILTTAYFLGSAFYVKSLIRELKNPKFRGISNCYHGLLLLVPFLLNWFMMIFAYLPSILKDWITPRNGKIKPMHSGIIEIINAAVFFVLVLIL